MSLAAGVRFRGARPADGGDGGVDSLTLADGGVLRHVGGDGSRASQAGGERQKQTGTCGGIAFAPIWTCATVPRDRGLPARRRNQALRESLGAAISSWRPENGSERPHGWWT